MNRGELKAELGFLLNFTEGTADQDFSTARLEKAIQYAYRNEVRQAKLEGLSRWFKSTSRPTWLANAPMYQLPPSISQTNIIAIWDITDGEPGSMISVSDSVYGGGDIAWWSTDTLVWGAMNTGPSSNILLKIEYLATAEFLTADTDSPKLIPAEYHDLLVWSAGIYLRTVGDEAPPAYWVEQQSEMRHDLWKFMSKGRPFSDVPTIGSSATRTEGFTDPAITPGSGGLDPP